MQQQDKRDYLIKPGIDTRFAISVNLLLSIKIFPVWARAGFHGKDKAFQRLIYPSMGLPVLQ